LYDLQQWARKRASTPFYRCSRFAQPLPNNFNGRRKLQAKKNGAQERRFLRTERDSYRCLKACASSLPPSSWNTQQMIALLQLHDE